MPGKFYSPNYIKTGLNTYLSEEFGDSEYVAFIDKTQVYFNDTKTKKELVIKKAAAFLKNIAGVKAVFTLNLIDGNSCKNNIQTLINNSFYLENSGDIIMHFHSGWMVERPYGSNYIQQEIIQLFLRKGCRMATAGEFTLRAFLNAKLDLSQAEAVADLISSDNEASHQIAMQQMRGGFSSEIAKLREELLNFASLIELELDFAEEDVEFADRGQFKDLVERIRFVLKRLIDSFAVGNVIKNGIPVAIVGEPNVGKSTLLNALLNEERAIVSEIAGTTRDTIEDEISIGGIGFRFIDTAGIRETKDVVESIGIKKTFQKIDQAQVVIFIADSTNFKDESFIHSFKIEVEKIKNKYPLKPLLIIANKVDKLNDQQIEFVKKDIPDIHLLSAKNAIGVEALKDKLLSFVNTGALRNNDTIVTNSRHYDSLLKAFEEIDKVKGGLESGLSGDLLAIDIRQALYYFGEITGEITNDDLLGNIFANFCIGK